MACNVVEYIFGDGVHDPLQTAQIFGSGNLVARIGVCKHEVAEGKFPTDILAEFVNQRFGVFDDESHAETLCHGTHALLRRLHQKRHRGIIPPNEVAEVDTRIQLLVARLVVLVNNEAHIRNNAQHIALVTLVQCNGIGIVGCHKDFRTGAFAHNLLLFVQCIAHSLPVLLQYEFVDCRQIGRIVAHRILD